MTAQDVYWDEFEDEEIDISEISMSLPESESVGVEPDDLEYGPVDFETGMSTSGSVDSTEHMLMSYLCNNHQLWVRCAPILKPEYFSKTMQPVVKMVTEFEQKNQQLPNRLLVMADTGLHLDVPEDAMDPIIVDEISNRFEEFCRFRATEDFFLSSAELLDSNRDRATMLHLTSEMERISQISVMQDLGYEVHADVVKLLQIAEDSDALPTGFTFLDEALFGGVTCPSYNIVSAASGQGKSICLQNLAVNYARQGFNVVYITLELPEFMIEKRFAAMMTNTDINGIYRNIDAVVSQIKRNSRKEGQIHVKRMPMNGSTIADVRAYMNELEASTGLEFAHLMLDYPDLMSPATPGIRPDNIHLKDQAVSVEIYDYAHDKRTPKTIWGAAQQVKGAKDEKDPRQSGVAGGVGKVNTSDNLLILKRSREDMQDDMCWGYIEKGRGGGQGTRVPIRWNGKTMRMSTPEDMRDLFVEANSPDGGDDDKPKGNKSKSNDPLFKARADRQSAAGKKSAEMSNKIREKLSRGKTR